MHGLGKILTNIMSVVLAVSLLAACGDTEPDLDFEPTVLSVSPGPRDLVFMSECRQPAGDGLAVP